MGMNTTEHTRGVLVVGAGYAGLLAANRLAGRGAHVTLVNERDTFVDRIRLHEVIAGYDPRDSTSIDAPVPPVVEANA